MKISDLMIGDWVRCKDNGACEQVSAILRSEPVGYARFDLIKTSNPMLQSEIKAYEPISLTPEIIKKNGLLLGRNIIRENNTPFGTMYDEVIINHSSYDIVGQQTKESWLISIKNNELNVFEGGHICIHIRYVHEFQHALRLLGLFDLADNFEIK